MTTRPSNAPALLQKTRAAWAAMPARERRLSLLAAAVVTLALLWGLALAPALRTLRQAPAQRAELQARAQHMQQLQAQAQALQAMPRTTADAAGQALKTATAQRLGENAQIQIAGERALITLKDVPAQTLADWLADARANARAIPLEAQLRRHLPDDQASASAPARWSGTLSLSLPAPQ